MGIWNGKPLLRYQLLAARVSGVFSRGMGKRKQKGKVEIGGKKEEWSTSWFDFLSLALLCALGSCYNITSSKKPSYQGPACGCDVKQDRVFFYHVVYLLLFRAWCPAVCQYQPGDTGSSHNVRRMEGEEEGWKGSKGRKERKKGGREKGTSTLRERERKEDMERRVGDSGFWERANRMDKLTDGWRLEGRAWRSGNCSSLFCLLSWGLGLL
ncbi:hypothetical protein VTK26DRAFT_4563 [Humicola hyalothermophila]